MRKKSMRKRPKPKKGVTFELIDWLMPRERAAVLLIQAGMSVSQAMREAGYSPSYARSSCHNFVKYPKVAAVLADFARQKESKNSNKMTREEWLEEHIAMFRDINTPISTKAALLDKIGKAQGFIKEDVPEGVQDTKSAQAKVRQLTDKELHKKAEELGIRIQISATGNRDDNNEI